MTTKQQFTVLSLVNLGKDDDAAPLPPRQFACNGSFNTVEKAMECAHGITLTCPLELKEEAEDGGQSSHFFITVMVTSETPGVHIRQTVVPLLREGDSGEEYDLPQLALSALNEMKYAVNSEKRRVIRRSTKLMAMSGKEMKESPMEKLVGVVTKCANLRLEQYNMDVARRALLQRLWDIQKQCSETPPDLLRSLREMYAKTNGLKGGLNELKMEELDLYSRGILDDDLPENLKVELRYICGGGEESVPLG
jgi:hypothetical protein